METLKWMLKKGMYAVGQLVLTLVIGVVAFRVAVGAWPDPEADIGIIRILNNGAVTWRIGASGNNLAFWDNVTSGLVKLTIYPGNAGGVGLTSRTNAQLLSDAPGAAGAIVFNSTTNSLCVSTGTGGGAWVYVSTGGAAAGGGTLQGLAACHS